jgi:chromosome segregation protein
VRLKRFELLGYKTFAARTEFVFDAGITAIVGPNGSGKSNIADAVRWVLGEQSYSLLRAKRSEDMIFAGSERRARMGMAEATITLDNSDNWLPVEFSEVAITRRSYRSGENEYLLNGSRVRLRDIADLLGKCGLSRRMYTVVGQGLVDAVLSLRPPERRGLIEEAAGLTLYQSRRTEALGRLDETRQNVLRVYDLITEFEPQVKRLQKQAERANEHDLIRQELDGALRIWYGYQWKLGQGELSRLRAAAQYHLDRLESQRARVQELGKRIAELRARQARLRSQLGEWHRASSALHTRSEAQQRDLAVLEERRRLHIQRREELLSEIVPLEASFAAQKEQIAAVQAELAALLETYSQQQMAVEAAQAALEARQKEVSGWVAAQSEAEGQRMMLRTQIADRESRLTQLGEREHELLVSQEGYEGACRSLQAELRTRRGELAALDQKWESLGKAVQALDEKRTQLEQNAAVVQEQRQALGEERNGLDQRWGRLRERYDLLSRMRDEGAGLYDGVRNVLQASRDGGRRLGGIVGPVAELVQAPRELETAIEVALGGQLQDVVVESWSDAEAAIDHLKRTRGGRATFLPLDTLRPARPLVGAKGDGVVGLASDLVQCESRLRPVVEYLLGRTIICRDLSVARRVLNSMRGSYQIVTPDGELARSSGAVTGGTRKQQRQGGILARERERRELPEQIEALQKERQALSERLRQAVEEAAAIHDQLGSLAERGATLAEQRREIEQGQVRVRRQCDQAEQELRLRRSLLDESQREVEEVAARQARAQEELADLRSRYAAVEERWLELQSRIENHDDQDLRAELAALQAEAAAIRQQQASKQAERQGYERSLSQAERQIVDRQRRVGELVQELAVTDERIAELRQQQSTLSAEIQSYADRIEPAERELEQMEGLQGQHEEEEGAAQIRLQSLETRYSRAELEATRQQDRMENLRRQIRNDLGLVELEMGEDLSGQPLLPLESMVSFLPEVEILPEGLEQQMNALKRRLHRLGAVNPDAPSEYQEVRQRYDFLAAQAQDLEQAIADLNQVIAELDEVMEREFKHTFDAIAREFRVHFAKLFDGGSARLELTEPDDLMSTGVDIVARPPGKRQQGLALLSGGERALTAAALIFAILTVSPPPFCVLDEMDAALDEANVGRFRATLDELAAHTQFVIITHNRYTIEVADIVYGVSMGEDGVSCVLSRRMRGQPEEG